MRSLPPFIKMYLQHLANSSTGPTLGDPVQEVRSPPPSHLLLTSHLIPPPPYTDSPTPICPSPRLQPRPRLLHPVRSHQGSIEFIQEPREEREECSSYSCMFSSFLPSIFLPSSLLLSCLFASSITSLKHLTPFTRTRTHTPPGHTRPHSPLQIRSDYPSPHPLLAAPDRRRRRT